MSFFRKRPCCLKICIPFLLRLFLKYFTYLHCIRTVMLELHKSIISFTIILYITYYHNNLLNFISTHSIASLVFGFTKKPAMETQWIVLEISTSIRKVCWMHDQTLSWRRVWLWRSVLFSLYIVYNLFVKGSKLGWDTSFSTWWCLLSNTIICNMC